MKFQVWIIFRKEGRNLAIILFFNKLKLLPFLDKQTLEEKNNPNKFQYSSFILKTLDTKSNLSDAV